MSTRRFSRSRPAPIPAPVAIPAPAAAPNAVIAGPGALKAAGVSAGAPSAPSVVVEPGLADETAVELTNPKKKEEESERRWFNQ